MLLNIAGLITLLVMSNKYFDGVKVGGLSQVIMDLFSQSAISLHAANTLQQTRIITYPNDYLHAQVFIEAANHSYVTSYLLRETLIRSVQEMQDSLVFPIDPQTGFASAIIVDLEQLVTDLSVLVNGLDLVAQNIAKPTINDVNLILYKQTLNTIM